MGINKEVEELFDLVSTITSVVDLDEIVGTKMAMAAAIRIFITNTIECKELL